ncbi:hypothetical protein PHMEG_00024718 [Phytophthora megakarya]|uniref:Ubiquitin-like protease family profile domain-containing protein n=1 Tax=Phytophthora megakarya TaxID=4795 RepID=A0A225VF87_9STRA|nr:hypothetical protein PHMEG_00024718 [Phytophthora megakarya]
MSMFDWSAYQYVLVPLSGRNHSSFLIVEHTSSRQQGKMYHVDSLMGAHSSEYVFVVFKWFFARYVADKTGDPNATLEATTSEFKTKLQQTNFIGCGVYLLYYMGRISTLIASCQPTSIEDDLATWTHSGFNATKTEQYRALLHQRLHEDMTP